MKLGMTKQCVNWKTVTFTSVEGKPFQADLASVIDRHYKRELLSRILSMPTKRPILFEDAVRLIGQKFNASLDEKKVKEALAHIYSFVETLSEAGYHIELTGDEFEFLNQPQMAG